MPIKPRNEAHAFEMLLSDCQHVFDRMSPSFAHCFDTARPDFGDVSFRIHDGEEWIHAYPVPDSAELVASANSTGEDMLEVYAPDGRWIASFHLIYGNAPDGSELMADCYAVTESAFAEAVFSRFTSRFN